VNEYIYRRGWPTPKRTFQIRLRNGLKALDEHGAIRETVELILKSKAIRDSMLDRGRA
jgi:hypothetical protein